MNNNVKLEKLLMEDREQFIIDNQAAFNYGALEEFGLRDNNFEEDGQIISRETIEKSIAQGEVYRIYFNENKVGGIVVNVNGEKAELELLFITPGNGSKGIGYNAWCQLEKLYPEVKIWGTITPYFETRNIHFYVNRCGFKIVEFFNKYHKDPNDPESEEVESDGQFPDGMFRFEKVIE